MTAAMLATAVVWSIPSGSVASSMTFVVDSLADGVDEEPGDGVCATSTGHCTLRAAVEEANARGGSHEVVLGAGVHQIGPGGPLTIEVTGDVSIVGAGREATVIAWFGNDNGSIFRVLENAALSLTGLTLTQDDPDRWAEGVVLGRDGASLVVHDVSFDGLGSAGVAAWRLAPGDDDPSNLDVRITDSTFLSGAGSYDVFVVSPGGSAIELHRTTHVGKADSVPVFMAGVSGGPGGNTVGVFDADLVAGDGFWDGIEAYHDFDVTVVGSTLDGFSSGIFQNGGSILLRDSEILNSAAIGIVANGTDVVVERSLLAGNQTAIDLVGTLRVVDSTIADNTEGIRQGFSGSSPAEIVSSTISGNHRIGVNLAPGSTLTNVTIVGNGHGPPGEEGGSEAGFSFAGSAGTPIDFTMHNTVIAGNGTDCGGWGDLHVEGHHNADGDGTCGLTNPGDQSGIDPMVGPLTDNGGPTPTHLPLPGSPLVDAGDDTTCPATDQRGALRPFDGTGDGTARCDIGAVEAGAEALARTTVTWSGPAARRGMLRPDAPLHVAATSQPGGAATASIEVQSWFPDGEPPEVDPDATMLGAPEPAIIVVPLDETSPGSYAGELSLVGISSVDSIDVTVAFDGFELVGSAEAGLPVSVAGALELDTALDVPAWMLPSGTAIVHGTTTGDGDSLLVPLEGQVRTRWLIPGDEYAVRIADAEQRPVAEPVGPVEVRGGLVVPVEVSPGVFPHVPLSVIVRDVNEEPRAGMKVTLTDLATGDEIAKRTTGPDGVVDAVARGGTVAIGIDPLDTPYLPVDDVVVLGELDEVIFVEAGVALPTAVVSGVIDHPDRPPVPGARVTFASEVDGRTFTTATRTGADGTYSAVVFEGEVTVAVDEPRAGRASETLVLSGDTVVDLMLAGPLLIDVDLEFSTRYAGQTEPTVSSIDGAVGFHMSLFMLSGPTVRTSVMAPSVQVPLHPGEGLQFCASGHKVDLPAACVDVDVDVVEQTGTASLLLEQSGRIEGSVAWTPVDLDDGLATYLPAVSIVLFRVEDGRLAQVRRWSRHGAGDPESDEWTLDFVVPILEPGTYEVRFEVHHMVQVQCGGQSWEVPNCGRQWWGTSFARVRSEVLADAVVDVGVLPTSPRGSGFASADSYTSVSPTDLLPGQTATARVSLHNTSVETLTDARLRLEPPPQAELVPGSVMLDGVPAAYEVIGHVIEIPVGDVAPGAIVAATAWIALADVFDAPGLAVVGSVAVGAAVTELGVGAAVVRRLTLEAMNLTSQLTVPVWGRAIPNSVVEVILDGVPAATATATPGGLWSAVVTLPEVPLQRRFAIQATSDGPDGPILSPIRRVTHDPTLPTLRRVELHQNGGRLVSIDPAKGVALFPYTWWPQSPIFVDLDFDEPHRVGPPTIWIGSATADTAYDSSTGLWRAAVSPMGSQLGDLRVRWEPVQQGLDLAPSEPAEPPTEEQVRAYLPPTLSTFSRVQVMDDTVGAPIVEIDFPDFPDEHGAPATTTLSIETEQIEYEPTATDLELAERSGVPAWGLDLTRVEEGDDVVWSVVAIVPESELDTVSSGQIQSARLAPQQVGTVARSLEIAWKLTRATEGAITGLGALTDVIGGAAIAGYQERLSLLLDRVDAQCSTDLALDFQERLAELSELHLGGVGISMALVAISPALAPVSLGLGTLAVIGLAALINAVIETYLDSKLRSLERQVAQDCGDDEDEEEPEVLDDCPPEADLIPAALGGPSCETIAKPSWIHDPSGFVYDVFEHDRLEGVTATVQHAPSVDGPWTIWDAEWYLQENPMLTDADGRYGWDVPEGWWRVRWDFDGYETAYSESLEVLPPHFDVDVGLRNLAVPDVDEIRAWGGRTAIDVDFDLWMDAATLHPGNVELRDGSDEVVDVEVEPIDLAVAASGDDVAIGVSIDVGRPLEVGEFFTLVLDKMMSSAGEVLLGEDAVIGITIVDPPPEAQAISFAPLTDVTYGSSPRALGVSSTSGLPVSVVASGPCVVQSGQVAVTGVGPCQLTATQAGDDAWIPADPVVVSFTVLPAALTVRADDVASTVGDVPPVYGATATGLVAGDTLAALGGLSCVSSAPVVSGQLAAAGSFTVSCSGLNAPNYTVTYMAGAHVVSAVAEVEPPPADDEPPPADGVTPPDGGVTPPATDIVPLQPARLLDTRSPMSTIDGESAGAGVRPAGSITIVRVAGRGGVPADAAAAVLNLTVVEPEDPGFASVYPCGQAVPNASNVNFLAGVTVPNAVVTKLGSNGSICVFTSAAAQLLIDANAYIPSGSAIETLAPARLLDTRSPDSTVDGSAAGDGRREAGSVTVVPVTGRGGVVPGAAAAVLNVTIVEPGEDGYATVFPCDEPVPNASNLNFRAGVSVANSAAVSRLGANGAVCIFTSADTHLLADVSGQVMAGSGVGALQPARLYDSRGPDATIDGAQSGEGVRSAGSITTVQVAGRGGVAPDAVAAVLNVTAVHPVDPGYASVFPCDRPVPNASSLNFLAGAATPNAAIAKLAADGTVCIFTSADLDLLVDVNAHVRPS